MEDVTSSGLGGVCSTMLYELYELYSLMHKGNIFKQIGFLCRL